MQAFELTAIGGPWGRRLAPRRAWIDELPEAARRVLLDARDAQPSWPLVERTEGAVLRPKQRIPSLRPRT